MNNGYGYSVHHGASGRSVYIDEGGQLHPVFFKLQLNKLNFHVFQLGPTGLGFATDSDNDSFGRLL